MLINLFQSIMVFILSALTLMWSASGFAITQSELEKLTPQQAYKKGKLLSWQYKYDESNQYLKYSADKGNADAAIVYASNVRGNMLIMKPEEYKYVILAAEKAQPFGLLKAASNRNYQGEKEREYWRQKALTFFNQKIQKGDAEALFYKASLIKDSEDKIDWIEKSAKAGFPQAKYYMAEHYKNGHGTFFIPGNREKEIKRLYKEAAEAGYPPAMDEYGALLLDDNDYEGLNYYLQKQLNAGLAGTIVFLAEVYSGDRFKLIPNEPRPYSFIKEDLVKAAGLYQIYFQEMNVDINKGAASVRYEQYQKLLKSLTKDQKAQADKFAQDYLATHTVRAFDGFWQWGVDYGAKPSQ